MNNLLRDSFRTFSRRSSRNDVESGAQAQANSLDNFFVKVQEIDGQYMKMNQLLKKLQDSNMESKALTNASAMKAIRQEMDKDVDEVRKIAHSAKLKIEELDKENLANRQNRGCGKGTGVDRTRTATTLALKKKFKEKIGEFQILRENIHLEYREIMERRVFTVTGTRADEETIDRLIETGDGEQIFKRAIQEQGRGLITDTMSEIQERHDAALDLERKLLELQQIFLDIAVLVDAQGEMLDNIETHVSSAVDHIELGNGALLKAKHGQKSSRKWMCIAIVILLVVIAIVLVSVLQPWHSNRGA